MDYSNRVGSKKGGGGIASASVENAYRKKQVDDILIGEKIPFTTTQQEDHDDSDELQRKNPYIYKNSSGKLVCKLCNTMHVSWTSVERHLKGKKHGVNLMKRSSAVASGKTGKATLSEQELLEIEKREKKEASLNVVRDEINGTEIVPIDDFQMTKVQNHDGDEGILLKIQYGGQRLWNDNMPPFIRIINGLELENPQKAGETTPREQYKQDKNYLTVSFPPYESVGVEIPGDKVIKTSIHHNSNDQYESTSLTVDELNKRACLWDKDNNQLFVQVFFH